VANYRFRAVVDIDVKNAESESEAREKAFGIMSAANASPGKGRTPSGAKASVTGVVIDAAEIISPQISESLRTTADVTE